MQIGGDVRDGGEVGGISGFWKKGKVRVKVGANRDGVDGCWNNRIGVRGVERNVKVDPVEIERGGSVGRGVGLVGSVVGGIQRGGVHGRVSVGGCGVVGGFCCVIEVMFFR